MDLSLNRIRAAQRLGTERGVLKKVPRAELEKKQSTY